MNLKPFVSQTKLPSSGDAISVHNGRPEMIFEDFHPGKLVSSKDFLK